MLPPEILEKIFEYLNYYELLNITGVNYLWRDLACRTAKKRLYILTNDQLFDFKHKWHKHFCEHNWAELYYNWSIWQESDFSKYVNFTQCAFRHEGSEDITCIAVRGEFIAIGYHNGFVKVYRGRGECVAEYKNLRESEDEVYKIHLVPDPVLPSQPGDIVVLYDDEIFINDFNYKHHFISYHDFFNHKTFSAYMSNFCVVSRKNLLIMRISNDKNARSKRIDIIYTISLKQTLDNNGHSPYMLTYLSDNKCLIIINTTLKIINYTDLKCASGKNQIVDIQLNNSIQPTGVQSQQYSWIFQNNVIFNIHYFSETDDEVFQVYFLGDETKSQCVRTFSIRRTLKSLVYVVYLHGNILVLALENAVLLFYNVKQWNNFDVKNYDGIIELPMHLGSIRSIDVVEKCGEQAFYVSGDYDVFTVTARSNWLVKDKVVDAAVLKKLVVFPLPNSSKLACHSH